MRQRWRARWITPGGLEQEYRFISLNSRVIARIDLGLQLIDLGYPVPDEVLLEEENPQPEGLHWNSPTITGGVYGS